MKILLLGGTKFFGARLSKILQEQGHDLTILSRHKLPKFINITIDRFDLKAMKKSLNLSTWDIVYDQICYGPDHAQISVDIFNGNIGKYIYTSTGSVYDDLNKKILLETDKNPLSALIKMGSYKDFTYGEAKFLAEAVLFQKSEFQVAALRFPFVVGVDDYTKRTLFHIQRSFQEKDLYFPKLGAQCSFISSLEAAQALDYSKDPNIGGVYNICSNGSISLRSFMDQIESVLRKKIIYASSPSDENHSPYGLDNDFSLSNEKALNAGFKFRETKLVMKELIEKLFQQNQSD